MGLKNQKKNQKKIERSFSVFPVFVCGPFIPLVSSLDLKHAEKQSKTPRVQSFGAKSGARAAKPHASGGLRAKNFKILRARGPR